MATLSLTGILGAALVWSAYLLLVRDGRGSRRSPGLIAARGIGAALYQVNELGILSRFAHLETPGTSIYFRLTAPYRLIGESLERFPFGYPLGQTEFIASRHYYINWEQGSQTNIDNTLLMVVFYFGLLGIAFNAAYVLKAAQYLVLRRHVIGLFMLSLLIALCTTGAGWAHHVVLMIGYAIVVGRFLQGQRAARTAAPQERLAPRRSFRRAQPGRRRAQRRKQRALPLPGLLEVSLLDVTEAADLLRQPGELHRDLVIGRAELRQHLLDDGLVLGDQAPLQSPLGAVAERIERGAAQPLAAGEIPHRASAPRGHTRAS